MVWGWLNKILGKKDEPSVPPSKLGSTHTMGPEELLKPEDMEGEEDEGEAISPEYEPIAGVHEMPATKWKRKGDADEENEEMEWDETPARGRELNVPKGDALKIMEAALFMAGKGMNVDELGRAANVPLLRARGYIPEMVDAFNARESALEIVEDTGGYRMKVRSPYEEKVAGLAGQGELNPAEMKTLAFIAYKQPLLQSQLVQVRSNTAYEHLQVLVEKGFVAREPKGRSYILRTTKKFSEYFGTHALKLKPMVKQENSPSEKPDHSQAEELS